MTTEASPFVQLASENPPRCLQPFSTRYAGWPISFWPDSAPYVCGFEISCSCGSDWLSASGVPDEEIGIFGPIQISCPICDECNCLFDVSRHGYDGEYGHGTSYPDAEGESQQYRCAACENHTFEVRPWFTYQFESLDEFSEIETKNIPNYFDVFGVIMICSRCKGESEIGAYECA